MLPDLERDGVRMFYLSSASPTLGVEALLPAIEAASDEPLPAWHRTGVTANSKAMYIYTSGTTGELGNLPGSALGGAMRSLRGWVRMGSLEGSWGGLSPTLTIAGPPGPGVSCVHGRVTHHVPEFVLVGVGWDLPCQPSTQTRPNS